MVVGDQGAFDGCVGFPVVPDRGGEGEESCGDAGVDWDSPKIVKGSVMPLPVGQR